MTQRKNANILSEVKKNYKISYNLLMENWKPFVKTELFTLFIILLIVIVLKIFTMFYQLNFFIVQKIREGSGTQIQIQLLIYFNLIVILNLLLLTFLTSQFGLANDIFTSGHMYAEFSSSFTYYRRHKFSYALLTLVIFWSEFLTDPLTLLPLVALFEKSNIIPVGISSLPSNNFLNTINFFGTLQRDLLLDFVQIISIFLIVEILASITKTNSLKTAIKENFDILKKNKYLISITWLIFFLIFILPETLINILLLLIIRYFFSSSSLIILGIIHLVIVLLFLFISMPFMVLLSTRMYVSLHNDQT